MKLPKFKRKKQQTQPDTPGRITNETVAKHREQVLAGGRKFKYPLQYTKHRLVWVSTLVIVVALIVMVLIGYWQLYVAQNTGRFIHSLTQVVPVPVATVDGQWVRYGSYLTELRSSLHYLSSKEAVNFNSVDGKRQLEYQKRLALNKAIDNALIQKLGRDNNVNVTNQEVDDFIRRQISNNTLGVTEDVYRQVIRDYYDLSFNEYKSSIANQLLRKKVLAKIDTESRKKSESILEKLNKKNSDFADIAKRYSEDLATKAQGGMFAADKNADDPNGLITEAQKLKPGQVSGIIEGNDGLYIIKLISQKDNTIQFAKILVSYKALPKLVKTLKDSGKINEYIKVEQVIDPSRE